jgi:uncharacterized protein
MVGRVAALWQFPVKSFQGVPVASVHLDHDGPRGDRAWGVLDVGADALLSAKRTGQLLEAFVDGDRAILPADPSGRPRAIAVLGSAALDQALTEWLGRPVRLVHVDDEPTLHQSMHFDNEDESSAVVRWRTLRGRYVDLFPLHFITTATLAAASARHPELDWDVRRFRPNFVLDADVDERELFGATLCIGDAVVHVPAQLAERCVMTTRRQPPAPGGAPALDQQRSLLRTLARDAGQPDAALTAGSAIAQLGAYAEVVTPGVVRVGDRVELFS